ncbi:MAG: zinc ribbon domain-containing protein [Nitrososphaerota archaeon]|jgi:hypothetical protein|nr:zinc ribbon domain-containing protein [Nitrososphaerota archaeon]MDG7039962.1 zinc ribbon domain-containing protein [Nitrososphaerota archaeon]MDG7046946.1 zinc ribbon domain-containing protein [Nitrososphaerota archaeon]
MIYCDKCGAELPDDAKFCYKCGAQVGAPATGASLQGQKGQPKAQENILAPAGITSLKCPSCGAPITPKFGEMIITCEYCGSSITLANDGWKSIQKHTMLPLKFVDEGQVEERVKKLMDRGLLHRHLEESSVKEEFSLSYIPYWVVTVSARTTVTSQNVAAQVGQTATEAAVFGILLGGMGGGFGGRRFISTGRGFGPTLFFMGGYGGGGNVTVNTIDANYNYPVIAVKSLMEYQPKNYEFAMNERVLFDVSKVKSIKVLNGDLGEDAAKGQARTLVEQLQSDRAHKQYHMIQKLQTEVEVSEGELLHAPVWFARYDHKGKKIVLLIDGNSGNTINSIGL